MQLPRLHFVFDAIMEIEPRFLWLNARKIERGKRELVPSHSNLWKAILISFYSADSESCEQNK
jgi:hypothetical protein